MDDADLTAEREERMAELARRYARREPALAATGLCLNCEELLATIAASARRSAGTTTPSASACPVWAGGPSPTTEPSLLSPGIACPRHELRRPLNRGGFFLSPRLPPRLARAAQPVRGLRGL